MKSYYSLDVEQYNTKKKNKKVFAFLAFFCALFCASVYFLVFKTVKKQNFLVAKGQSLATVSQKAEQDGLVNSSLALRVFMQLNSLEVKSGTYEFEGRQSIFTVASRLAKADYGDVHFFVTIPEGSTLSQMSKILENTKDISFDAQMFSDLTQDLEGYLFPDTYAFLPGMGTAEIVDLMRLEFDKNISKLAPKDIEEKLLNERVILASIIEKEASNDLEQKQMIADILFRRMEKGIALQVDAPFLYERGKGSAQLSHADLRADSSYNTYTNLGLTPGAIGSPGYDSLYAVFNPKTNPYYFYLHGKDGNIHYGKSYSEHLKNKRLYID